MEKIYHVDLTPKEKRYLQKIVRVGTNKAKVISRAHTLLKSSEGKTDKDIAALLYIDEETVRRTRQRFWDGGMEEALHGQPYPPPEPKLTDEQEAYLIALACSDPPEGYARWTIELLTEQMVTDGIVLSISRDKVRLTLKKTNSSLGW
jgi:transposase